MRRLALLAAAAVLAAPPVAGAARYAFGRSGGNIVPFTVSIAPTGAVSASGPVKVGRTRLSAAQLATLDRAVAAARFSSLPATTLCPGTLPDIAATFVTVGARTVHVHGSCTPRYARLYAALTAAVRLSYG